MQYVKGFKSGSIVVTSHFKLSILFLRKSRLRGRILKSDEEKSPLLKLVELIIKQTETVEHTYFIYATIYSFSSKHEFKLKF